MPLMSILLLAAINLFTAVTTSQAGCPLDIIFVLDGSSSVGRDNFVIVKNWVTESAQRFSTEDVQIGVIQYSYYYMDRPMTDQPFLKTEIPLGPYKSLPFEAAMKSIQLQNFQTWTAHAMNKTVMEFETSSRYYDSDTIKVMILVTDGQSTDKGDVPSTAAYLRSLGIKSIAVGIGQADKKELKIIADGDDGVFYIENLSDLSSIALKLTRDVLAICPLDPKPTSS